MWRTRAASVLGAATLAVATLPLSAGTASAHAFTIHQHEDSGSVMADHATFWVDDAECDGNSVHTQVYLQNGGTGGFADANGCNPGSYSLTYTHPPVLSFRVCEMRGATSVPLACTSWNPV